MKKSQIFQSKILSSSQQSQSAYKNHQMYKIKFVITLIVLQIIVIVIFGLFGKVRPHVDSHLNSNVYPKYQDINVMMLIGFGFLMTFLRNYSWSALAYTFFLNAIVVQYYILFQFFWACAFSDSYFWGESIYLDQKKLTLSLYSVCAVLISFGTLLGKIGLFELLLMSIFQTFAYALNQKIISKALMVYDAGGSISIHIFGAFFGLTVSFLLHKVVSPKNKKIVRSNISNLFTFLGVLFLWVFWPSFNVAFYPQTPLQKTTIIINTVISLTGSCLGTFIISNLFQQNIGQKDLLNSTLAGGIAIGASSTLIVNTSFSLIIGLLAGIVSSFFSYKFTKIVQKQFDIFDTCRILSVHGIPGIIGGLSSAIIFLGYTTIPLQLIMAKRELRFYSLTYRDRTYNQQALYQVIGTFSSMGIGILAGIVVGIILKCIYSYEDQNNDFYEDKVYFSIPEIDHAQQFLKQYGYKFKPKNNTQQRQHQQSSIMNQNKIRSKNNIYPQPLDNSKQNLTKHQLQIRIQTIEMMMDNQSKQQQYQMSNEINENS